MSAFRPIEAERTRFSVPLMCKMLGVSRSGYYDWRGRPPSGRSREDANLTEEIREIHERSRRTYGSPGVHAELRSTGTRCSRKRVARLMPERPDYRAACAVEGNGPPAAARERYLPRTS